MSEIQNSTRFDVTALPMNMREKIMVSIDQKLTNGSVCWEWTGAQTSRGYGCVANGRKGKNTLTHRKAYELLVGPILDGLQIDHLCFNKLCLNTDHLEAVTPTENVRRAAARTTHCQNGHPYSGDNLRLSKRKNGHVHRVCVTCQRAWGRAHYHRTKGRQKDRAA